MESFVYTWQNDGFDSKLTNDGKWSKIEKISNEIQRKGAVSAYGLNNEIKH